MAGETIQYSENMAELKKRFTRFEDLVLEHTTRRSREFTISLDTALAVVSYVGELEKLSGVPAGEKQGC